MAGVAVDRKGRVVLVWESPNQDGDGWGVYGRRFDASFKPLGDEFRLSDWTQGDQRRPQVAVHPDGDFMVAWAGRGKQGIGVYYRLFDAEGKALRGETRVNVDPVSHPQVTSLVVESRGDFLINWTVFGPGSRSTGFVQRVGRSGEPIRKPVQVTPRVGCTHGECRVASGPGGRWAAAFCDPEDFDVIWARVFDENDSPLGDPIRASISSDGPRGISGVAVDARDNLLVVWAGHGVSDANGGIFCRRYDAAGNPLDKREVVVNTHTGGAQDAAAVTGRAAGDALIAWHSSGEDGSERGVYARYIDAAGKPSGAAFRVNSMTAGDQVGPALAVNDDGLCVVVWQGNGPGDDYGVFARCFRFPETKP